MSDRFFHVDRRGKRVYIGEDILNTSGIVPVADKVLLLPDRIAEKQGEIHLPEVAMHQRQFSQVRALLIAYGPNAFEDWDSPPVPGDRVMICKYAGIIDIHGVDGRIYQIITDVDVTARITEEFPEGVVPELGPPREPLGKTTTPGEGARIIKP